MSNPEEIEAGKPLAGKAKSRSLLLGKGFIAKKVTREIGVFA